MCRCSTGKRQLNARPGGQKLKATDLDQLFAVASHSFGDWLAREIGRFGIVALRIVSNVFVHTQHARSRTLPEALNRVFGHNREPSNCLCLCRPTVLLVIPFCWFGLPADRAGCRSYNQL